jgi:type IV pilus assembly protein PilY1
VVIFTSGYNNGSSHGNGDGQGYLYMVDALTGQLLKRLTTGSGTAASPSGFAKINGWADAANSNNTVTQVYGGDLDGNLWRFDLDSASAGYLTTTKIAQAISATSNPQPITVKPELGAYQGKRIVLFGTGKFLEAADKTGPFTSNENTIYALLDDLSTGAGPLIGSVRGAQIVGRSLTAGTLPGTRTVTGGTNPTWSGGTGNWGWRIDLPDPGERVNVDPQLQLGTLVVASNVPNADNCTAGGISYLNYLDYATGSYVQGANGNMASVNIGSSLTVGINVIMLPGGKVVTIATTAANQQLTQDTPVAQANFQARRVSWRELVQE